VIKLTLIIRCELCKGYTSCKIYDKVCENLQFLQLFIDIKESVEIAKHCKIFIREGLIKSYKSSKM